MNLALLLQFGFSASLQKIARWLPVPKAGQIHPPLTPLDESHSATHGSPVGQTPRHPETDPLFALHRPLRVVRILEAGQPRSHVGRMVISGCMADVCAELDRLAACEAALP